jgi:hypothetical protein
VGCGACTAEICGDSRDISGEEGRLKDYKKIYGIFFKFLSK